jgi:hypothetical protein
MEKNYLESIKKQFKYYKNLGDKTIERLSDNEIHRQHNSDTNSIAIIVKHLWGNMLSRWTDFLTTDGEKTWRKRDAEFENDIKNKEELLVKWNEGWNCLFDALNALTANDLEKIIYIRNEGHTVMEAINRQLAHYPYHIGQMVHIAKELKGENWESLSIPKNKSKEFNAEKFSKEKSIRHFTNSEN